MHDYIRLHCITNHQAQCTYKYTVYTRSALWNNGCTYSIEFYLKPFCPWHVVSWLYSLVLRLSVPRSSGDNQEKESGNKATSCVELKKNWGALSSVSNFQLQDQRRMKETPVSRQNAKLNAIVLLLIKISAHSSTIEANCLSNDFSLVTLKSVLRIPLSCFFKKNQKWSCCCGFAC